MSDHASDRFFRSGQYDDAIAKLREGVEKQGEDGRDVLLYLMDLGLVLHTAGKFEESNQIFLKADKIADISDYTSLSTEAATLLTSDNIKHYKGEDFEKVLINTYLAINYAVMGDYENALVEARRVNTKLYRMVTEGQRKYKQNAFARYLSAVLYEAEGEYNDAYIDYKKTRELDPAFPLIGKDLWRMAYALKMRDDQEKWDEEFHLTQADHDSAKQLLPKRNHKDNRSEIIVLYENGISPVKRPNPQFTQVPRFFPRSNPVSGAKIEVSGSGQSLEGSTFVLHDIESTAIFNLEEKYGALVAKKLAGIVAKEVVGNQVEKATDSKFLGFLTKLALYASDQADVRSWNLLPKDLQVARFTVNPGTYQVKAIPIGVGALQEKTVQVASGKKIFVCFRFIPS
jgi:uncharacterized protein